jgi:hypothetical protein
MPIHTSHVTHTHQSCDTYTPVTWHVHTSHVTHVHQSCDTYADTHFLPDFSPLESHTRDPMLILPSSEPQTEEAYTHHTQTHIHTLYENTPNVNTTQYSVCIQSAVTSTTSSTIDEHARTVYCTIFLSSRAALYCMDIQYILYTHMYVYAHVHEHPYHVHCKYRLLNTMTYVQCTYVLVEYVCLHHCLSTAHLCTYFEATYLQAIIHVRHTNHTVYTVQWTTHISTYF